MARKQTVAKTPNINHAMSVLPLSASERYCRGVNAECECWIDRGKICRATKGWQLLPPTRYSDVNSSNEPRPIGVVRDDMRRSNCRDGRSWQ
jgi:hypothetical protein